MRLLISTCCIALLFAACGHAAHDRQEDDSTRYGTDSVYLDKNSDRSGTEFPDDDDYYSREHDTRHVYDSMRLRDTGTDNHETDKNSTNTNNDAGDRGVDSARLRPGGGATP